MKDLRQLAEIEGDIIISKEIGEDKAYPGNCSSRLGFGVCSGFYVAKPSALKYIQDILSRMLEMRYGNYSDQVTMMNSFVDNGFLTGTSLVNLDGIAYTNRLVETESIKICVLDFEIIRRNPVSDQGHYGMHINIDSVSDSNEFIKYFYEDFQSLPSTCRCRMNNVNCVHKAF